MKKILAAALILIAGTYFGCSDNITSTEPSLKTASSVSWIALSKNSALAKEGNLSVSEKIVGNKGGDLSLSGSYPGAGYNTVYVNAELTVPKRAYHGAKTLTMEIGDDAVVDLYPQMTFDNPLNLNLTFSGLDLTGVNPSEVNFYYIDPDGNLEIAENDGITVDIANGTLSVKNAKIPHFSRYGFAK